MERKATMVVIFRVATWGMWLLSRSCGQYSVWVELCRGRSRRCWQWFICQSVSETWKTRQQLWVRRVLGSGRNSLIDIFLSVYTESVYFRWNDPRWAGFSWCYIVAIQLANLKYIDVKPMFVQARLSGTVFASSFFRFQRSGQLKLWSSLWSATWRSWGCNKKDIASLNIQH